MYWYLDQSLTRVFYKTKMKIFVFWLILYLMMFGLYWAQPQTLTSMKSLHSSDTARHRFKLAVSSLKGKWDRRQVLRHFSSFTSGKHSGGKSPGPRRRDWSSGPAFWGTKRSAWWWWLFWAFCCDCTASFTGRGCNSELCQLWWLASVMQQWEEESRWCRRLIISLPCLITS